MILFPLSRKVLNPCTMTHKYYLSFLVLMKAIEKGFIFRIKK
jgi:hypothetical protein